jgi:hypothetical protein
MEMSDAHVAMWHRFQKALLKVAQEPWKYKSANAVDSHGYTEAQRVLIRGSEEELRQTLRFWEFTYPELFE